MVDPPRPVQQVPDLDSGLRIAPGARARRELEHEPLRPHGVVVEHGRLGVQAAEPVQVEPAGHRPPRGGRVGGRPGKARIERPGEGRQEVSTPV